ncbi:MAG: carboxypeptidase-like regulatory domain-containing protein, partial [Deltaproteobacteria bacterium]|nr:carboxypeptidase-like regulatory domain-containing protein [Deltaproteobacteria bacterium]
MTGITKKSYMIRIAIAALFLAAAGYYMTADAAQSLAQNRQETIIRGRVTSTYGPVQNARVRIAGGEQYALTDREGRYELVAAHRPGQQLMVTAGKEGWFNNGQAADRSGRVQDISLNPIYLNDHPGYRFISPVTCSRCHVNLTRYYDQSKMAHTTSNPKVLDMYYGTDALLRKGMGPGYRLDNPQSQG